MPTDLKWRQNKRGGRKSRCKPLKRQASLPLRAHAEVRSQKIGRFGHQVACAHPLNAICRTCRELGRARARFAVHSQRAHARARLGFTESLCAIIRQATGDRQPLREASGRVAPGANASAAGTAAAKHSATIALRMVPYYCGGHVPARTDTNRSTLQLLSLFSQFQDFRTLVT